MLRATCLVVVAGLAQVGALGACGSAKAAAAKDPMKCERDPSCAEQRGRYPDCTRQCQDDDPCMKRCEEVQAGVDRLGQP